MEIQVSELQVGDMLKVPYGYDLVTETRRGYRGQLSISLDSGPIKMAQTSTVTVWRDVPDPIVVNRAPTSDLPTFKGTPRDWFENAERITNYQADNKEMGVWYIRKVRNSAGADAGNSFNVNTPSTPRQPTVPQYGSDYECEHTRILYRSKSSGPAWTKAKWILAEIPGGGAEKELWTRNKNGRWRLVEDGRITVTDSKMYDLNPTPAQFSPVEVEK
jgi:hypothetical protein